MISPNHSQVMGDGSRLRTGHHSSPAGVSGLENAWTLNYVVRVRVNPASLGPRVQVSPTVDDLPPELVEGRAHVFVTPLCELVAVTDQIKLGVAEDVVLGIIEDTI